MSREITILDGAMGAALRNYGVRVPDYRTSAWSALALIEAPSVVQRLHHDYIRAGADVITTNNYAVTPQSLATEGLADRLGELTVLACRLAMAARDREAPAVRLAGSLPPLNISYRADLVGPYDELVRHYRELAGLLAPYVDIFLCETMTTFVEARAAAGVACEFGKPVWLSLTLEDDSGCLRGGESISQAARDLSDLALDAVLINCCSTRAVDKGLPGMGAFRSSATGVYANPFRIEPSEDYDVGGKPNRLSPSDYARTAVGWIGLGASIIGGCCGTSPDYIAALKDHLTAH